MSKHLSIVTMIFGAFVGLILLMAFGLQQQGNGKGKNEKAQQQQNKGNQKGNENKGAANKADNDKGKPGNGNANANRGNNDNNGNKGNGDANRGKANGNNNSIGKINSNNGNNPKGKAKGIGGDNWYSWNRDNYKDRTQFRNKQKVNICHKFNSNEEPVNITVSENAMKAHLAHGDVVGNCPAIRNSIWSDIFQRRRTAYYNDLYYGQDQYNYSNSILEYALMRLADSRSQLDYMRVNNYPQADIDRRQAAVTGLEQNVGLLETVLGVAGQYLASRLL